MLAERRSNQSIKEYRLWFPAMLVLYKLIKGEHTDDSTRNGGVRLRDVYNAIIYQGKFRDRRQTK